MSSSTTPFVPYSFGDVYNPAPTEERQPRPNPLPKTVDPLDWECPNVDCKNINFKKRNRCNRCGEEKPTDATPDPRLTKKEVIPFDWWCMQCGTKNLATYLRCVECSNVRPEERAMRAQLHGGKAGGFFDRQDPGDRNTWDSDEESVDDFGRKKKKKTPAKQTERQNLALARLASRSGKDRSRSRSFPRGAAQPR